MKRFQFQYSIYIEVKAADEGTAEVLASQLAFAVVTPEGAEMDNESPDAIHEMTKCGECGEWYLEQFNDECPYFHEAPGMFTDRPSQIDNMTASDDPEPYFPEE